MLCRNMGRSLNDINPVMMMHATCSIDVGSFSVRYPRKIDRLLQLPAAYIAPQSTAPADHLEVSVVLSGLPSFFPLGTKRGNSWIDQALAPNVA